MPTNVYVQWSCLCWWMCSRLYLSIRILTKFEWSLRCYFGLSSVFFNFFFNFFNIRYSDLTQFYFSETCGSNAMFAACALGKCENTCSNPNLTSSPNCNTKGACTSACFCRTGFVKLPTGECKNPNSCP